MGVGYDVVDEALNSGLLVRTMALLCVLKMVATTISYVSGNAGGIFAPTRYIGAMACGALVGMGALFAGIIRAPMTSVFMIFEITQDYQILVPLMVANMLSFVISRHHQPEPVYHALLRQDNVHLQRALEHVPAGRTARDVMPPLQHDQAAMARDSAVHVHPEHPLDVVLERLTGAHGPLPVVDRRDTRRVVGIISWDSLFDTVIPRTGEPPCA